MRYVAAYMDVSSSRRLESNRKPGVVGSVRRRRCDAEPGPMLERT